MAAEEKLLDLFLVSDPVSLESICGGLGWEGDVRGRHVSLSVSCSSFALVALTRNFF